MSRRRGASAPFRCQLCGLGCWWKRTCARWSVTNHLQRRQIIDHRAGGGGGWGEEHGSIARPIHCAHGPRLPCSHAGALRGHTDRRFGSDSPALARRPPAATRTGSGSRRAPARMPPVRGQTDRRCGSGSPALACRSPPTAARTGSPRLHVAADRALLTPHRPSHSIRPRYTWTGSAVARLRPHGGPALARAARPAATGLPGRGFVAHSHTTGLGSLIRIAARTTLPLRGRTNG